MATTHVLSLGGSLFVPETGIDSSFLQSFRALILERVKMGETFFIVVGGGYTARMYQDALRATGSVPSDDLDWIGVDATILNARFVAYMFGQDADRTIITNPTEYESSDKPIRIASGWKPGWSSDYDAVCIAKKEGVNSIINLSNVSQVFDSDPSKNTQATPFKELAWDEYLKLVPDEWSAGLSTPFDPIASRLAQEASVSVAILGRDISNLESYLAGGSFLGTVIS